MSAPVQCASPQPIMRESQQSDAVESAPPRRRTVLRWTIRGIIAVATVGAVAVALPELRTALPALRDASPMLLAVALGCQVAALAVLALSYTAALRGLRGAVGYRQALEATLGAFALSRLLPAGGFAGGVHAARRLSAAGNSSVVAAAAVTVTGVVTMITLGLIVTAAATLTATAGNAPADMLVPAAVIAVVLAIALQIPFVVLRRPTALRLIESWIRRLPGTGTDAATWTRSLRVTSEAFDSGAFARVAGWSALNWVLQAASLGFCLAAVGVSLPLGVLVLGLGAANLATALPHTPGGLGVVEAGMTATYVAFGIPTGAAVLGVLCYRLVSFWLPVAAAGVAMPLARRSRGWTLP